MDLNDLEELKNLNELDLLYKIIDIAEHSIRDTEKVIVENFWKVPGVRVRQNMQDIKLLSDIIRDNIQIRKGKVDIKILDKAIATEEQSLLNKKEMSVQKKQERMQKINERKWPKRKK